MTAPTAPAPGFYADPLDPSGERWWDGAVWTESIRPAVPPAAGVLDPEPGSSPAIQDLGLVPKVGPEPQLAPEPKLTPESQLTHEPPVVPQLAPEPAAVQAPLIPQVEPEPEPGAAAAVSESLESDAAEPEAAEPEAAEPGSGIPAGLYPDPYGQAPLRWWDGEQWTTQTSEPPSATPAFVPAQGVPSDVLPLSRGRAGTGASSSGSPLSLASLRSRISLPSAHDVRSWRPGRRAVAGVLVAVLALVARIYLTDGHSSPDAPAPASLASAVNLRPGDLPKGWVLPKAATSDSSDATDTGDIAFQRDMDRCTGAPDASTAATFAASSNAWTRGTTGISSDVTVLRTPALAQQGLRAAQGSKVSACLGRVGIPALRPTLARKGVTLTGLSVSRLPGAPRDGFALRMKMTMASGHRTLTVWTDSYGFVRGNVEVDLTVVGSGALPDRAVAAQALKQLRTRANAAIPLH